MLTDDSFIRTLTRLIAFLRGNAPRSHLTGGLVSSLYGEPRLTQDIDVVLGLPFGNSDAQFIDALQQGFLVDPESFQEAVKNSRMFQAFDQETSIKIDFHVGEKVPGELDRSVVTELLPGISVPVVSLEDAILSKLLWIQRGSHKSRQDVVMMFRNQDRVDTTYLENQASALGVLDLLNDLRKEARIAD